jgi:hypothetical protein
MSKNISLEHILNDVANKDIIFAAVDNNIHPRQIIDNGIYFFPDDYKARQFRFGRKNVIYLNEVADKDCKHCDGTGKTGVEISRVSEGTYRQIRNLIESDLGKSSAIDLPKAINAVLFEKDMDFIEPLKYLLDVAEKELTDNNASEIAERFAKIIKNDFVIKEVLWCECFVKNLQKEVERVRREIKFSIN